MKPRVLAVLLLLLAFVTITPGTACACTCAPFDAATQVKRADAIFTGTVVSARRLEGDPLGPPPPIVYTLRADQVYKGGALAEYRVLTNADSAACGFAFAVGSRYLVFASDEQTGMFPADTGVSLHTTLCDGDQLVRPGNGPLRAEDGDPNGQPISAALLTAIGTPTRPAPATPTAPAPDSSAPTSGSAPVSPWIYAGGAAVILLLGFAAWRFLSRRRV
ncbi:hypothetical protein GCM10017673_11500 [Streptosporangium violaceochromogenes]|nr:hypothetical protein GCM10017673_11500 [Streptosporangium violaceochromogenes]